MHSLYPVWVCARSEEAGYFIVRNYTGLVKSRAFVIERSEDLGYFTCNETKPGIVKSRSKGLAVA